MADDKLDAIIARLDDIATTLKRMAPPERGEFRWRGRPLDKISDRELERAFLWANVDCDFRDGDRAIAIFPITAEMTKRGIPWDVKVTSHG